MGDTQQEIVFHFSAAGIPSTIMKLAAEMSGRDWELMWAPYDEPTYQTVLGWVEPEDVVLEIGAGDFRFARRLAERASRCYAIEINADFAARAEQSVLPENLTIIHADAYTYPFPKEISLAVLLMRHCQRFQELAGKLRAAECRKMVTNARWRESVEIIDLMALRRSFSELAFGWYACWCGTIGFIPGPAQCLTPKSEQVVQEVHSCPVCNPSEKNPWGMPVVEKVTTIPSNKIA